MSNNIKQLRGQVRQIVKELLPDIFKEELIQEIKRQLSVEIDAKFRVLEERQKSLMHLLLKQGMDKPKL